MLLSLVQAPRALVNSAAEPFCHLSCHLIEAFLAHLTFLKFLTFQSICHRCTYHNPNRLDAEDANAKKLIIFCVFFAFSYYCSWRDLITVSW